MISELCSANEKEAVSKLIITDDNIFCKDGALNEPGIIENIAQTAAAMSGYNALESKEEVKRGFIGSVNNLKINTLPKTGTEIETKVIIETQVMNVNIIRGVISQNNNVLAECEMKIFLEE